MPTKTQNPKTAKTPKLRFPGFFGEWEEKKLGDVLKVGSGKDHKNLKDGDVPVFGTGGYMRSVNKSLHSGETVFIGRKGTIDKPFYYNGDFWTVDTLFFTHEFDGITPKFTNYIFQKINWQKYNEASGVPSLSKTTIERIKVRLPLVEEQRKIAEFLGVVDEWIENLKKQKESFESYKKSLMQKIFTEEIRFKNEKGKEFPKWEEKKLGEVFEIRAGGDIDSKNVFSKKTDKFKYPIFANSEKNKGLYGYSDIYKIDYDCITVTGRGSLGVAVARSEKFYPIVRLLILKPKDKSDINFFENFINQMSFFVESTGVPQLTGPQISNYILNIPKYEEQKKIAEFLMSIDSIIESKQQQITQAGQWKKGLMQGLFV